MAVVKKSTRNDTFNLFATNDYKEIHKWGYGGNDLFNLDFSNVAAKYSHGHHVYGGSGYDTFNFKNFNNVSNIVVGRLDDFDPTFDKIQINGRTYNPNSLPSNAKIVNYDGTAGDSAVGTQQWLLIKSKAGGYLFYALEGARYTPGNDGARGNPYNEKHFVKVAKSTLDNLWKSGATKYDDPVSFVPSKYFKYEDYIKGVGNKNYAQIDPHQNKMVSHTSKLVVDKFGSEDSYIVGGLGHNVIYAGGGHDVIDGNRFVDRLFGQDGNDLIAGGGSNDYLYGGNGNDRLWGGDGNDYMKGDNGNDTMSGNDGNDRMIGGKGHDRMYGNQGNDHLSGWSGNDRISGGRGNDRLYGNKGDDRLDGYYGNDRLYGGPGNDTLIGHRGNDYLHGRDGKDTFLFRKGDGRDYVADYQDNYDKLQITAVSKFSDLKISSASGGTNVDYGSGSFFLKNVNANQLTDSDFIFA